MTNMTNGVVAMNTALPEIDFSVFEDNHHTTHALVNDAINVAIAAATDKNRKTLSDQSKNALAMIMAKFLIDNVGGVDTWLGKIMLKAMVRQSTWWTAFVKDGEKGLTYGAMFRKALVTVSDENSEQVGEMFNNALRLFLQYSVVKNDQDQDVFVKWIDRKEKTYEELELMGDSDTFGVQMTASGLQLSVNKGYVINPIRGQAFNFERNVRQTFGMGVINQHLETVLRSIRIHNVNTKTVDKGLPTEVQYEDFTQEPYKFDSRNVLSLLLVLKENNIDFKELFENAVKGNGHILVLKREEKARHVRSLSRVSVPAHTFKKKYGVSGVTSTTQAANGFVAPVVNIPRLVEFFEQDQGTVVYTRENPNKTISRVDKLNNADALWTRTIKVFVAANLESHPVLNKYTVGGCILTPDYIIKTDGVCRVVNEMDLGGIKASTVPFQGLDKELAKGDMCVISAAGFKGGLLAALGLSFDNIELVKSLVNSVSMANSTLASGLTEEQIMGIDARSDHVVEQYKRALESKLVTKIIGGQEVQGVLTTVEVKITNAYTLDFFRVAEQKQEDLLPGEKAMGKAKLAISNAVEEMESGYRVSKGIRAYVAEQKAALGEDGFSVCDWVKSSLKDGTLVRKGLTTKVISQEIQTIALTEGQDVAIAFLDELLAMQSEAGYKINKLLAYQLLGAIDKDISRTVYVQDVLDVLVENHATREDSVSYSKSLTQELVSLFGTTEASWINLVYPNGEVVEVPSGTILLGDALTQLESEAPFVVMKGLLADVLKNIKGLLDEKKVLRTNTQNHLVLEALIQKPLLGKNFGYQYVKGFYGVALPLIGNYAITTAGVTNRDRLIKDDATWTAMTLSKAPQYFKGMTATYNVLDLDFGHDMNLMLECAVFVNVEVVMMHQNDFDGDMYRINLGSSLPFVTRIYNEFNGKFFEDFYNDELASNKLKAKKSNVASLEEFHEAMFRAVSAKEHIGVYTANSYFYEAMLPNVVNNDILTSKGNDLHVTADMAYKLTALLKMLIQVEAMDNVKQEGSSMYITEMMLHYKLRTIRPFTGQTLEEAIAKRLSSIVKALMKLVENKHIDLSRDEVEDLVELAYYTAIRYNKDNTTVLNMFGARNIDEKNLNNVLAYIKGEDEELNTIFNFKNRFEELVSGQDRNSMYFHILTRTFDSISDCSEFRI